MKRTGLKLAMAVMCAATGASAQAALDRFDISINAEVPEDQSAIVTLATTFAMMAPQTSGQRKASRLEFRSGAGMVDGATASQKLRDLLPEQLGLSVARLDAMRRPCDVSRHRFDDVDVVVVIHDTAGARPQDAQRCFVAGLWIYHAGGNEGVNVDNWRIPYVRILESVAGGRPAYAGLPAGEN